MKKLLVRWMKPKPRRHSTIRGSHGISELKLSITSQVAAFFYFSLSLSL